MIGRTPSHFAFSSLLAFVATTASIAVPLACGTDPASEPTPPFEGGADPDAARPDGSTPLSKPPVSGAYRWYSDVTPAPYGNAFAVGSDGRVAFATSPTEAGTVAGAPFTHFGPGTSTPNYDLLVAVVDPSGKLAWQKSFATAEIESATSIAFDEAGDVYVVGIFKDNSDGLDFGNGVTVGIGQGEISNFLVKLRGMDGVALWATSIRSGDAYVKPLCSVHGKGLTLRDGHGAVACSFDAGDGNRSVRIVSAAGQLDVIGAARGDNAIVLGFDPSTGKPESTFVLAGANLDVAAMRFGPASAIAIGATVGVGDVTDTAGGALSAVSPSCLVMTLGADGKPTLRRLLGGSGGSRCELRDLAFGAEGSVALGGVAGGAVDFGDGAPPMGTGEEAGFTGVLRGDGTALSTFERFAGESVFGLAIDGWGQTFVASTGLDSKSIRYTKRDADGKTLWQSKTYRPDPDGGAGRLLGGGVGVDGTGALTIGGDLRGPITFDDGVVRGGDGKSHYFALRFDP